jgi:two-component system sensor histidine kinase PilS (NtrC family)
VLKQPQQYINDKFPQSTNDAWDRLRLFNYFRGALALFFITIYFNGWLQELVHENNENTLLFIITSFIYLTSCVIFLSAIHYRFPRLQTQVFLQTLIDISCITVLMHSTGGIRTGLGMLLIISISMTCFFLQKKLTLLFASIATIAIIAEQIYAQLTGVIRTPAYTEAGLLGILIFITALLTTYLSKRLRESEKIAEEVNQELENVVQMNEHIIQSMRTGILVVKNTGVILMANNAALELLGNITIGTHTNIKSISAPLYQRFSEWNSNAIQNHKPIQQIQGLPDLQPGFSRIDQTQKGHGRTLIFIEDATQITQRFQQVKLASLGRLTASIAHEIRNPLAAISHAGQLLGETTADDADKKLTGIINTQTKRLNGIVENVLQLSRQQRGNPEVINLYQWLFQFKEEFISTYKLREYQIKIKITPEHINILFDTTQLHQVIWNLCSNAINHSNRDLHNIIINIQGQIEDETNQPYIDIIDNGQGINAETQAQIFEPFFTTDSNGTGLGLYITKEVLENNRAKIRHISPADGGTCFRIYFQKTQ